ncbi:RsmE family RNA methyltransferase [Paradesulfitobacterium aromaticivorans]
MHRFKIGERGQKMFWLHGPEREHLVRVLRLAPGDKVIGFDNSGGEWLGEVEQIYPESVGIRILGEHYPEVEAKSSVYLVTGLAKGDKLEWVVQKGTELGMAGLVPLRAKRSVVRLEGDKARERVKRWGKIAAQAAKQCQRVREPVIYPVSAWAELKELLPEVTQWVIPYEDEQGLHLSQALAELDRSLPLAILIGPEGGFEPEEVSWAFDFLTARAVTLGPRILRAETAALAALTIALSQWGDLG